MTADRSDAVVARWKPQGRAARRLLFEPTSEGNWLRREQVIDHTDSWQTVGTETTESIGFENVPPECVDGYDAEATPAATRLDDPAWDDDQTALDE